MTRRHVISLVGMVGFQVLTVASVAQAQSGLSRAVQALPRTTVNDLLTAIRSGRLYGGVIDATITERDRDRDTFGESDCIDFTIAPREPGLAPLRFVGPRTAAGTDVCPGTQGNFEQWASDEAASLLAIIFPSALASSSLARAPAELYAQQFLLTTALATEGIRRENGGSGAGGRAFAGGLIEFESISRDDRRSGDSGWAVQGLLGLGRMMSVQGRFTQQREDFTTRATTVSLDYHPFVEIEGPVVWRLGGTARGGFAYSSASAMDLGSLEFGGGGWVSGFKELGRVRLGGGTMLQGTKSYVPGLLVGDDDDLAFLVDAVNDRGVQYDMAFGGTVSVDTSQRTRVMTKFVQNSPVSSRDQRPDSWLMLAGLSYSVGLPTLNFGYKLYSTDVLTAHSVFFQGNFDW